ncbi:FAD:protein FMN transferase [Tabrizicola sp.]|uniref:FAD:protein FMN transferase n=1 Tax=Tabrizicola sp. TaxID=2005166 RepID=UPI001A428EF5|nr:FAD:protein FMN transferase [Tabrizicola sp.]MBL9072864.1 FAD:protein FMN transferase [Tabrizicola sp.]
MNRRRFLTLTAAALAPLPGHAATLTSWEGTGLGTSLTLHLVGADAHRARKCFTRVEAEIARIETLASLYRDSALTRLNRDGHLAWPSPDLLDLLTLAGQVHQATGGAFDPTVQPLWLALSQGTDTEAARDLIGWDRVRLSPEDIRLAPGQALTLNGIAQGWAADRIAALLRAQGFTEALVDMGEIAALGQPQGGWSAMIAGPDGAPLAETRLANRALATSSPRGTLVNGQPHILGPQGQPPVWQTASVSAPSAALADALSTAFCLMDREAIDKALAQFADARIEALA